MRRLFPFLVCIATLVPYHARAAVTPAFLARHVTSVEDRQAIEHVLAAYTDAVTRGDQAAFEALLLDDQVPFSSTNGLAGPGSGTAPVDTRQYAQFRQSIFQSGVHYIQHFYNVRIAQDGPLAQVSLDFVTQEADSGRGGYGWKVIQLLKVQGTWKIASEFYTGRPLPAPRS